MFTKTTIKPSFESCTKGFRKLLVPALLISLNTLFAQRVFNFSVSQNNAEVFYSFTFRSGSSCTGYQLTYSTDSLNFVGVDDYAGICGASGADEQFSGSHKTPKMNAWNYYRIQMGNFEMSEIRKVFMSSDGSLKAIVFPNPHVDENSELSFRISGANNLRVQGFIYDSKGINWQFIDTTTNADSAKLTINGFDNGLYILWLTDGTKMYKGKFLIMH